MNERERPLLELAAKSVTALLDELSALRDRQREGQEVRIPRVTLHLRTGRDLVGSVLRLEYERGGATLLFHAPERGALDVVYLAASAIEAVTVHDAPALARPPQSEMAQPAPTRLALKRRAAAVADSLSALIGAPVACELAFAPEPEAEDVMRVYGHVLDQVAAVLEKLAQDELGLGALRDKVGAVSVAIGADAAVALEARTLRLTTPGVWNRRLTGESLRQLVEQAL